MNDMAHEPATNEAIQTVPGAKEDSSRKKALLIVFLVVFIDLLGFGIVLPLLPLYGEEFIKPLPLGEANSLGRRIAEGLLLGFLMSSFSAMQFLFAPIWGRVSDHRGRRPILLMGLAGSVIFYALFGIASEFKEAGWLHLGLALLLLARVGAGISGATISTAQAVIADSTPANRRAKGMALIGAAFGIGFTFGPLLGFASLFAKGEGMPGYMASALSLAAFILGYFLLPETLQPGNVASRRRRFDFNALRFALASPAVGVLVFTFFLAIFAFANFETTLALLTKSLLFPELAHHKLAISREVLRTTERTNFLGFAYVGFVLMITQGFLYRRWVNRVGEIRFMQMGIILLTLGLIGLGSLAYLTIDGFIGSRTAILGGGMVIVTLAVIGFALVNPSIQSLISRRTDPSRQGEVLGVNQSAAALSRILGPIVGLSLFSLTDSHVLPYVFGTALLLWALVLAVRVKPMADATAGA